MEKLLLEACLEAMQTGAIVGIQDMGAAGLTCSTCEMGSRAGTGIEIDLCIVPQRETGMTPYEIMLVGVAGAHATGGRQGPRGRSVSTSSASGAWTPSQSARSRTTACCACGITARWSRRFPTVALADEAPLYNRPFTKPPAQVPHGSAGIRERRT